MKKRWLTVILVVLAICLVLPLVAACGRNNGDTSTNTDSGSDNTDTSTNSGNGGNEGDNTGDTENNGNASVLESKSAPVVKYLRIAELGDNSVTVKFNLVGEATSYEIRYSSKKITKKNYDKATVAECTVTGDGAIKTAVVEGITADKDNCKYITVKATNDVATSDFDMVRAGGIYLIELDHNNPQQLYNGETNRNLTALIDEQSIVGDPYRKDYNDLPISNIGRFWDERGTVYWNHTTTSTAERFGTQLAPIIDLEYVHYVDNVMVFYQDATYDVIIRASDDAANFNTPEAWDVEIHLKRNYNQITADILSYIKVLDSNGRETANGNIDVTVKEYNHFRAGLGDKYEEIKENNKISDEEREAQLTALVAAEVTAQRQYFEALVTALKSHESTKTFGEALDAAYKGETVDFDAIFAGYRKLDETARVTLQTDAAAAFTAADKACGIERGFEPYKGRLLVDEAVTSLDYEMIVPYSFMQVDIGIEARYVQVEFKDGEAPNEVLVYGYQVREDENMLIQEPTHRLPTIGEMMGQCGFVAGGGGNCTIEQLACSYVVREYHNLGWSYSLGSFPGKASNFVQTVVGNFDKAYKDYSEAGLLVIPCLQWNESSMPARLYDEFEGKFSNSIASWEEKYLPSTWAAYADVMYQYAARYGSSKMGYLVENILAHSDATPENCEVGRGQIKWLEFGNEPNGEDSAGATPYQCAALQSAAYDGHQRTVLSHIYNPNSFTYPFGAKTADPDIRVATAGFAGIQDRYIMTMSYWMRANRTDGSIAMDAFNVHTYFGKYFYMNDQSICVGVSPEEYGLVDAMSNLVQFRDKYYPDVEVWLTEFGWDTNQSYETMTSAHAYDTKDLNGDGEISEYEMVMRSREIQGMWLVRAYILLASCGVDKATMYMCEDAADDEVGAIGKYGTCGIWAVARMPETRYQIFDATITDVVRDENGNIVKDEEGNDKRESVEAEVYQIIVVEKNDKGEDVDVKSYYRTDNDELFYVNDPRVAKNENDKSTFSIESKMEAKDAYYYMYTLYKTLGDMAFVKEIQTDNPDVWVYEFANDNGKVGYAVWCPTSNGTVVEDFVLNIDGTKATLVETDSKNKDTDGVSTNLEITDNTVTITVSENPVYVVVE
ncbi:MAG: hypothetical protein IJD89_08075 [Clostridia bacterium]|nr:hypothetical protein [Clostridia bacterium]